MVRKETEGIKNKGGPRIYHSRASLYRYLDLPIAHRRVPSPFQRL